MSQDLYREYFGLSEAPFQLTPDADFLYLSTQHSLAQAYLNYSLLKRDSFVVITGDIGAGKTTLINKLLTEVQQHVLVARVFQTQVTPAQFLQAVLLEFGIRAFDKKKAELLHLLNRFLVEQHRKGRQIVLIVDEAQNLGSRVLEEIRLLSDVETDKTKILNVVLCGQPDLRGKLDSPGLEQLAQRIRYRFHINALNLVETGEYIEHRVRVAGGGDEPLFLPETIAEIFRYTGGIPRLINILCDTALTGAFAEDASAVSTRVLEASIAELDWQPYADRRALSTSTVETSEHAAGADAGRLVLTHSGEYVRDFDLDKDRLLIGRDSDNDIQIVAEYVSRHHAQFSLMRGAWWLSDLNSTNGTFVNGKRVAKRVLRDGDTIQLGRHRLTFVAPGAAPEASAQEPEELDAWRETTVLPLETTRQFRNI